MLAKITFLGLDGILLLGFPSDSVVKKSRDLSVNISAGGAMETGDPVTRELDADSPRDGEVVPKE